MIKKIIITIGNWFLRNFWNFFNVLGIILTIYFGVFYVPSWLRESQNERLKNVQVEIQQSVKELIFSDSSVDIKEISSLVHAKEITIKEKFPLTLSEILTKAEESFMEDRFLPLAKRQELIKKIEVLKLQLPKDSISSGKQNAKGEGFLWVEWFSIIGSLVAGIIGLISTFFKYQSDKDQEEEIKNEFIDVRYPIEAAKNAYDFERGIESVLRSHYDIHIIDNNYNYDKGIDFEFSFGNKQYFIQVKYLSKSKVGLATIRQLIYFMQDKSGEAWLVFNTDLTALVIKEIENFNQSHSDIKIKTLHATNAKEFANKLDAFLSK